jgi:hypothetical protein
MTRWASATLVSEDDDDGEWDAHGQCANCDHCGITGTLCPTCKDTGFIHESRDVRRGWQARVGRNRVSRVTWRQQVRARVQRLVLVGRPGNEFPEVGQVCLVLRKNDKKDLGQEAVVTKRTASRVHITIRDDNGWQATRVKHPVVDGILFGKD